MKQETAKKIIVSVFGSGILLFIGIQFIPVDRSNPPITHHALLAIRELFFIN